jgi:hypothetical protein
MSEIADCSACGLDENLNGRARHLEWNGQPHSFCSYRCEFFWRRDRYAEYRLIEMASEPRLSRFRVCPRYARDRYCAGHTTGGDFHAVYHSMLGMRRKRTSAWTFP